MKNYNKLDTAAKVFPAVANGNNSSVFRIAVILKEEVDPKSLQLALNLIYQRYNFFFLRLRRGVFWDYFDTNYYHCEVQEENDTPCSSIRSYENNGFAIKVLYYKNRISVEAFHSVTDGSGIIEFLKSLVYYYISIKYGAIDHQNKVLLFDETEKNDNDSFNEYFSKLSKRKLVKIKSAKSSYQVKGKIYPNGGHAVITGIVSVNDIKSYCKNQNCTITAFLIATLINAIYEEKVKKLKKPKYINIAVPVNLRKIFISKTLKNFFSVVKIGYEMCEDTKFDDLIKSVSLQLSQKIVESNLKSISSQNIKFSNNIFSKHTPLMLKNLIIPIGFNYLGELKKTMTLSNVGKVDFPDGIKPYVEHAEVLAYPTKKSPISCSVCSCEDKLSINFIRSIKDVSIIRNFFKTLANKLDTDVTIYSNMWGDTYE
ncbi:MAG: alcohol acetyltransferase [Clostridia bacterium]